MQTQRVMKSVGDENRYHRTHPPRPVSQVNGIDLRVASHDEAINVLRQTPQRVRLTVFREEAPHREQELWDLFFVELQKLPGQGLGFSIVGRRCLPLRSTLSGLVYSGFPAASE